jgi:hypothetical protein
MRIWKKLATGIGVVATFLFFASASQVKAQEPEYLHALSDLRTARDYLQFDKRPGIGSQRHHAIDEINKAIDEIKHAAWDDGKNTKFAPPSGVTDPYEPLKRAKRAMDGAIDDLKRGVDQPANQGLRERAIAHAREAELTIDPLIHWN